MKKNTEKDQLIQNSFDNLETEKPSRSVTEKAKNYAEQHPKRLNGRGISLTLRYGVAFLLVAIIIPAVSSLNNLGLFTSKSNATLESRQADMMNYVPATGNNSCYPISTKTTDVSLNGDSLEGLDVLQIVFNDVVNHTAMTKSPY